MTFAHPNSTVLSERCKHIGGLLFDKDGTLLDYAASWMPVNRRAASLAESRGGVVDRADVAIADDRHPVDRLDHRADPGAIDAAAEPLLAGPAVDDHRRDTRADR